VAGGDKVDAVLGAVKGGYIDVLITDDQTASAILAHERQVQSDLVV
jgi:DNA-binding transcriptional regulator LsrR (DeoR family)